MLVGRSPATSREKRKNLTRRCGSSRGLARGRKNYCSSRIEQWQLHGIVGSRASGSCRWQSTSSAIVTIPFCALDDSNSAAWLRRNTWNRGTTGSSHGAGRRQAAKAASALRTLGFSLARALDAPRLPVPVPLVSRRPTAAVSERRSPRSADQGNVLRERPSKEGSPTPEPWPAGQSTCARFVLLGPPFGLSLVEFDL
jgi:hypothetical protein